MRGSPVLGVAIRNSLVVKSPKKTLIRVAQAAKPHVVAQAGQCMDAGVAGEAGRRQVRRFTRHSGEPERASGDVAARRCHHAGHPNLDSEPIGGGKPPRLTVDDCGERRVERPYPRPEPPDAHPIGVAFFEVERPELGLVVGRVVPPVGCLDDVPPDGLTAVIPAEWRSRHPGADIGAPMFEHVVFDGGAVRSKALRPDLIAPDEPHQ